MCHHGCEAKAAPKEGEEHSKDEFGAVKGGTHHDTMRRLERGAFSPDQEDFGVSSVFGLWASNVSYNFEVGPCQRGPWYLAIVCAGAVTKT